MKSTDSTSLIPVVIASKAATGYVSTIPVSQTAVGNGTISLDLGSPPECAIAVEAGGKRPLMKDVNGVYNLLSAAIQAMQARGLLSFDASFAADIGGYPQWSVVYYSSAFWVSTADSNVTVPGTVNASWKSLFDGLQPAGDYATVDDFNNTVSALAWTQINASQNLTAPSWAKSIEVIQIGGGGGGAGCQGSAQTDSVSGAGGGAGGILRSRHLISGTLSQYVGAGGSGGAGGVSGQKGGDTYLVINGVTVATAGGGAGGDTYTTGGSSGGSGGTNTYTEDALIGSYTGSGGSDGQQGKFLFLGNGAPGYLGAGAGRAGSGEGLSGTSVGAGGGGAYDVNLSGTSYNGGTGASGACLYRWLP